MSFRFTLTLRYIPSNPVLWDGVHSVARLQKKRLGTASIPTQKISRCQRYATNVFVLVRSWRNGFLQKMEMSNQFPAIVKMKGNSSWETKTTFPLIISNKLSNWLIKYETSFHEKLKMENFDATWIIKLLNKSIWKSSFIKLRTFELLAEAQSSFFFL